MPSSSRPYKSKLLRFVLQQWQQGLKRQDLAWRQLQSTATLGAQVAILPIYAIMRAVKRASFALDSGNSSKQPKQPQQPVTPAKGHVTDIEHSLTAILTHTQQLLSPEQKKQLALAPNHGFINQVTSLLSGVASQIRQQLTRGFQRPGKLSSINKNLRKSGGLTTTHHKHQQLDSLTQEKTTNVRRSDSSNLWQNGTTLASSITTQKLVLVNLKNEVFDIFTPEQQTDLQYYVTRIIQAYEQAKGQQQARVDPQFKRLFAQSISAIQGQVVPIEQSHSAILTHTQQLLSSKQRDQLILVSKHSLIYPAKDPSSIHRRATSDIIQNGTTLASSLNNQRLVLVNSKNEVFDIFTPEQQADLKRYIEQVMQAYRQSRTIVPRPAKPLSPKTVLAISAAFMAALPMEFQKAWSQIAPGRKSPKLPPIIKNYPQPRSRIFPPSSTTANTVKARAHRLPSNSPKAHNARRLSSKDPHAFEADINDVSYLEHPLERILRWLDHVLTWCERRWQQWIEHRSK